MDLQHIDVGAQALNASVHRVEDVLAGQAHAVDKFAVVACRCRNGRKPTPVIHAEVTLGQDDDAVARDVVLLQSLAENRFRSAVGVDIRLPEPDQYVAFTLFKLSLCSTHRVPGVDTLLVGMLDQRQGFLFIQDPVLPLLATIGHGTQDDLGDLQA